MNSVWDAWVESGFEPARACVEARLARENLLVEMIKTKRVNLKYSKLTLFSILHLLLPILML